MQLRSVAGTRITPERRHHRKPSSCPLVAGVGLKRAIGGWPERLFATLALLVVAMQVSFLTNATETIIPRRGLWRVRPGPSCRWTVTPSDTNQRSKSGPFQLFDRSCRHWVFVEVLLGSTSRRRGLPARRLGRLSWRSTLSARPRGDALLTPITVRAADFACST